MSDNKEKSRYSDAELQEFKELITDKLENSRSELKYLQEQINRSGDMGDDSDTRFSGLEDGSATMEREYLNQMASRQIQYIQHLEKALIRIENKTYGICRDTGKLISAERLRAVPHATLSIEAKKAQNK
jgi:RNA polymerase-binding transcription factor DksA